ncbi:phage tail protein [Pelagivirga sediminicola]|uniref:Phage tail protein n=1 Tax=Pelagivirga sediminicola TaxID=2170575 RepID=A0A2T7G869_9RHOB|nr:phage head closure protein [Pelagivirga sediminicola]PVA10587.1 phage tail protein [Pelagivirga sediminicola]
MKHINLNRHLVLEAPERVADGAGGFAETWQPIGEVWAEIIARTGREVTEGAAQVSSTGYKITVRAAPWGAPSRPKPEQRLRGGGRIFRIEAVTERDPLGRYLTCYAQEEVAV